MYIWSDGELKPLGRVQTKVQISKFRSLLKSIPFVRQKVDINIPGAHSTSRYDLVRPTFFAFFPASRDVSKFKLLQSGTPEITFEARLNQNLEFKAKFLADKINATLTPPPAGQP